MKPYDHKKIEKKWQKTWADKKVYKTLDAKSAKAKGKKPYYVLDMFPYPSGAGLHVGHPRGYIASDVFARVKRMQGYNVLHPMGFDSFGLPAEQYAIKTGKNPGPFTNQLVKHYKNQLSILGFSYDWDRQVATHDPEYYRWTQWIFLQIYNSWYDKVKNKARPIDELVKIFEKSGNGKVSAAQSACTVFTAKQWKQFSEKEQQDILMNYRLVYQGYAEVNWCEELGTVLANDEIIQGPTGPVSERGGHPVMKKQMRQWFMRITAYADRLLSGLETIDWSHSIKEIQRNWIGKSEGSEITFFINNKEFDYFIGNVVVFTTRADTLFGVSYLALAVDHPMVDTLLKKEITNWDKVYEYIEDVKQQDRTNVKEITGIKLEGVFAGQSFIDDLEIPVYLTNYVIGNYGTGAVMGVPAHDERDFAFANVYDLPIKYVIARPAQEKPNNIHEYSRRDGVVSIVINKDNQVLILERKEKNTLFFPQGGIEQGEDLIEAAIREISEESGYCDVIFDKMLGVDENYFETPEKRYRLTYSLVFKLNTEKNIGQRLEEYEQGITSTWMSFDDALKSINFRNHKLFLERYLDTRVQCFENYGVVVNSGEFNDLTSEQAKQKITEFVGGRMVTKYKFRDAIFARQRYWGEPIPLVHEKDGTITPLKDKQLPLELPKVKSYVPSGNGEGPLATVKSWVNAGYETNTMPGWAGSSWYFLRYIDAMNKKSFASESELDYWFGKNGGVDMYVGGQEHATGHLLYSRFWHKVLHDLGYVKTDEPFKALRNQGMILGTDGVKMSKRYGNIVNPDDVVHDMGADTLRVYEAFMGPFNATLPWSTDGIVGSRRFIERIWRFAEKVSDKKSAPELEKALHKMIKKVTSDIADFGFNTAVSAMMIFANELEKQESINIKDWEKFLQVLAPFAPHITDELWSAVGNKQSIHVSEWPKFDPKKVIDDTVTIGVQINGKVRAEITIEQGIDEKVLREKVLALPDIMKWIDGKQIKKFIYIQGRIINIVI